VPDLQVTDGWVGSEVAQQLDWFHIGMRIEHLRSAANLPMTYEDFLYRRAALDPLQKRIEASGRRSGEGSAGAPR
jgi:hypothetical protein